MCLQNFKWDKQRQILAFKMESKKKESMKKEKEHVRLITKVALPSYGTIVSLPLLLSFVIFLVSWDKSKYLKIKDLESLAIIVRPIPAIYTYFLLALTYAILFAEVFLTYSMSKGNRMYVRVHHYVITSLWTMIAVDFGLAIWYILEPSSGADVNLHKFIIIFCSAVLLISSFLNYYIKIFSEFTLLFLRNLPKEKCVYLYV
ncbi:unnamed protein product [Orchesella dallaii]|uniref:Uncharacterized protein n=1 Tax=Orchesella dallaii TaxID=48710 RepID=A0ABP1QVM2_9HEXA